MPQRVPCQSTGAVCSPGATSGLGLRGASLDLALFRWKELLRLSRNRISIPNSLGFFLCPIQNSPELDEEGYSIRPEEPGKHFYSSSESEEEEEAHKKFNIKIKPLQAKDILKSAATVDELKASIGNIALSPSPVRTQTPLALKELKLFGFALTQQGCAGMPAEPAGLEVQRVTASGKSFCLFDVNVAVYVFFNLLLFYVFLQSRPFSPPIHSSSPPPIAPLARAESTSSISSTNSLSAATTPTVGSSRGPSPLTMGAQDTLPVAAAFTETVNAYFKGADPNKCIVKITGEMVLSFPAGITRHFANNPAPAVLTFRVLNYNRLEHVLPNPQLLCCDNTQSDTNTKEFWVNMPNLMTHLKKVSEQKPQATYYNVDMLKYQVSAQGIQSTPLNLAVSWRCDPASTDLRIDYKYNTEAMTTPVALNNVQFLVPVDGGVTKLQAVLPPAVWNAEQQRILWKIPDISQKSENGGVGSLLARFQLSEGPSTPAPLAVQFTSEGSTLSSCDIELVGAGYRFSLIKKRFAAGRCLDCCAWNGF
uniref:SH3-containing GRB2-like protein 3-interacting protein 1 n=1 Tax=Aquila chrysaetos chrysaetos TaxID=223781 RepID=A0A663FJA8_AQUCH